MKKPGIFKEAYMVKFNYQKPDAYWVVGCIEKVYIDCQHGINEKNSHQEAENYIKDKYPGCHIVRVTLE